MKVVVVIPARYGSTRFPAKPLAPILGKPMIQWTVVGAQKSKLASQVIVATDHLEIVEAVRAVGAQAVMTDSDLPSGSDRINAAVANIDADIVVNVQGDEPLISGELIDRLAQVLIDDVHLEMATLAHPMSSEELQSPNAVKVILNNKDEAIYFSRFAIPHSRVQPTQSTDIIPLKHVGMYAYRKEFLKSFCQQAPAAIEIAESLEQLRALNMGARIKVLRIAEATLGVDTPEDILKVENAIKNQRI
ncbi:MAG: 3-deoxy-manno-octulosonate cytidylyltransferase [Bdellovibrionia bacterium]